MNKAQQDFLEQLALRIPRLFEVIAQGNIKSEYIVGIRRIGSRNVRLKLVAEVVDPGANPLATHGQMRTHTAQRQTVEPNTAVAAGDAADSGSGFNSGSETATPPVPPVPAVPHAPASRHRRPRRR
ncbi:MAG: hypothetical protein HKN42_16405 [Granulosicoccus sp.]|nr:hypothetical protein [Granulosicoccus sp.]